MVFLICLSSSWWISTTRSWNWDNPLSILCVHSCRWSGLTQSTVWGTNAWKNNIHSLKLPYRQFSVSIYGIKDVVLRAFWYVIDIFDLINVVLVIFWKWSSLKTWLQYKFVQVLKTSFYWHTLLYWTKKCPNFSCKVYWEFS